MTADRPTAERATRAKRAGFIAVVVVLLPALANAGIARWQHFRNPVPGQIRTVEGRRMHIACTGNGSPTVIIEVGASATWLAWDRVQRQLSRTTRVCSYDRAGHGWSEQRPGRRDAEAIVAELHALLDAAGEKRPAVFVGHSAGGLYVREYAREFPGEVAGVALIDASSPGQLDELPGWRASHERDRRNRPRQLLRERISTWSGWERLRGRCRNEPSPEMAYLAGQYNALMCRPGYVGGEESELMDFEASARQAGRLTTFGPIPLLIVSRDTATGREPGSREAQTDSIWNLEQEAFRKLSPRSWRVIARGSGHAVHHDRLDLVAHHLSLLIGAVRGAGVPYYGRTVTE